VNHKTTVFHLTDDEAITNVYILSPSHITPVVYEAQIVICDRILENLPFGHKQTFDKSQLKILS